MVSTEEPPWGAKTLIAESRACLDRADCHYIQHYKSVPTN